MPINILVAYDVNSANLSVQITDEGQGLGEQMQHQMKRILDKQDYHEEVRPESDDNLSGFYRSLLICKTSVDQHSGSIGFYSNEVQRGTTFEFNMLMGIEGTEQIPKVAIKPNKKQISQETGIEFLEQLPNLMGGTICTKRKQKRCLTIIEEEERPSSSKSAVASLTSNRSFNNQSEINSMIGAPIETNQDGIYLEIENDLSIDEFDLMQNFEETNLRNPWMA